MVPYTITLMNRARLVLCVTLLAACTSASPDGKGKEIAVKPIDPANLDTTCAPCQDFYQFANGGWLKNNPIPAAYSQWGSFHELRDRSTDLLRDVLEATVAEQNKTSDPTLKKLAAFYASCMDTVKIEELGATPIAGALARITAIETSHDARVYLTERHATGYNLVFAHGATPDSKKSTDVIFAMQQAGLGLPDRDYYFKTDSHSVQLRKDYVEHIANMLTLAGQPREEATADAQRVFALETELAKASMTNVERRDPVATYNKKTREELAKLAPGFDWGTYFKTLNVPDGVPTDVQQPKFIATVDKLFNTLPVDDWKAYFRWHLVRSAAPRLSKAFVDEDFAFEAKLTGVKEQLPRYKTCVQATDQMMGEALGKAYVDRHFPPEAKARAMEMVKNLKEAFRERLATRTWMSDSTREQAYAKLETFMDKIGYPDKWMDYTPLKVTPENSYFENYVATTKFLTDDDVSQVGKPVDRNRWGMTPPTVNAYYHPLLNEIVFPAGILQPPFFDPNADDAVNYGGMGAVIGHEITHGFDDQGSQFDAQGNLRQWFTAKDLANFKSRTKLVEEQFDNYTILDSVRVNGKLTLGENIADLGGLTIAYAALQKSLEKNPVTEKIDGFTPEQRFFLAWAQIWRMNIRDEMARMRAYTDPHSPSIWRTNGPISNMPEFAKAFGCKEGDPMVRPADKRADIW
jgi:putative endopeptidase